MNKRRLGTGPSGGFQQIEGPNRVGIEIVEGNLRRAVMGGLRSCVYDSVRFETLHQIKDAGPIPDVQLLVMKSSHFFLESLLVPPGIALSPEKYGSLIVVHSVHLPPDTRKMNTHL